MVFRFFSRKSPNTNNEECAGNEHQKQQYISAAAWLQDQDCDPSCAILCDSKSVVEAVSKARLSSQEQSPAINSVRRFLSDHPQVILQLVRGHSDYLGMKLHIKQPSQQPRT